MSTKESKSRSRVSRKALSDDLLSTPSTHVHHSSSSPTKKPVPSKRIAREKHIPLLSTETPRKSRSDEKLNDENAANITPHTTDENKVGTKIKETAVKLDLIPESDETYQSSPQAKTSSKSIPSSKLVIPKNVKDVYSMIVKRTGCIGGNGSTGAIYGELTIGSMQKIVDVLVSKCNLNNQSRFMDVGAGLGKPNFHVAQTPRVRVSLGIELETVRWQLSMYNLQYVLNNIINGKTHIYGNVNFIASDIDAAKSTDPFTHVYMYDLGFPPPLQQSIARKFNDSVHAEYLISYRPPHRVINEYLYCVDLIDQIPTSMHGSGEIHTAYIYKRNNKPRERAEGDVTLSIPSREGFEETVEIVVTDELFASAISLAVGDINHLYNHVKSISDNFMNAERPNRHRKLKVH